MANKEDRYNVKVTLEVVKLNNSEQGNGKSPRTHNDAVYNYNEIPYGSLVSIEAALEMTSRQLVKMGVATAEQIDSPVILPDGF